MWSYKPKSFYYTYQSYLSAQNILSKVWDNMREIKEKKKKEQPSHLQI